MENLRKTILTGLAERRSSGIHELGDDRYIASIIKEQVPISVLKELNRSSGTTFIYNLKLPISMPYVDHVYFELKERL